MIWTIIHTIDIVLWVIVASSVIYVTIFAIASLKQWRSRRLRPADLRLEPERPRFLILFPAYREDRVIFHSVETFLKQDYPKELYHVGVISDHMQPATNEWLAKQPISLFQPQFEKSSKAKALQYAIEETENEERRAERFEAPHDNKTNQTSQFSTLNSQFSHVVILDADNVVEADFLARLSAVCMQGYKAIQCHRTAKNSDNDIAQLDGLSEEINNSIFRRAHNNIGLSSALIGSGMCFDYDWFATNVFQLNTAVEDRELEALLLKQDIYIKYESDICVYDEKVSNQDNFQRQRMRWMTGQVQAFLQMLSYLPTALAKGNVNYVDKTIQQALIPRSILLAILPVMSLLMAIIAPVWSIKWWILLIVFCVSLFVVIPPRLHTKTLFGLLLILPYLVWRLLKNIVHIDHKNTDFIHTTHDK